MTIKYIIFILALILIPLSTLASENTNNKFIGLWRPEGNADDNFTIIFQEDNTVYFDYKIGTDIIGKYSNLADKTVLNINGREYFIEINPKDTLILQQQHLKQRYERVKNAEDVTITPSYYNSSKKIGIISYVEKNNDWQNEWRFDLLEKYQSLNIVWVSEDKKDTKTLVMFDDIKCGDGNIDFTLRTGKNEIFNSKPSFSYGYSRIVKQISADNSCSPAGVVTRFVIDADKIINTEIILKAPKPFPFFFEDGELPLAKYIVKKEGLNKTYFLNLIFRKKSTKDDSDQFL